jgi:predicted TIM-barrel fold metal-dependent hydrolase
MIENRPQMTATSRRGFVKATIGTMASNAWLCGLEAAPLATAEGSLVLIDVNVNLSRWPTRRVRGDDAAASLVEMLRRQGVTQAWAGSFDGLLRNDIASVNARLTDECHRHGSGVLIPFGSINPTLPGWEEDVRRCSEEHRMPGIRVHPNYHGIKLDAPEFARLLRVASERRLIVQLALVMEDERTMHPLLRIAPVDSAPLANLVKQTPGLRLVLLNALRTLRGDALRELIDAGEVYVEISMVEGVGGVSSVLSDLPPDRILFGSHAPLFYFESALLKLKESPLTEKQLGAIRYENASRLLAQNR